MGGKGPVGTRGGGGMPCMVWQHDESYVRYALHSDYRDSFTTG